MNTSALHPAFCSGSLRISSLCSVVSFTLRRILSISWDISSTISGASPVFLRYSSFGTTDESWLIMFMYSSNALMSASMNPEFAVLSVGKRSITPLISMGTSQPETLTI